VIDLHTHLLPGVDDGAESLDEAVPVLERFAAEGITVVVCTPHLDASVAHEAPVAEHAELHAALAARAPAGLTLRTGWEIQLDLPGVDLTSPSLHLGGSTAALVEFHNMTVPPNSAKEIFRLRMSGVVPVLAHPERYRGATLDLVEEWRGAGAVMQLDAWMLFGRAPMCKLARQLLQEGLIDCIASDNHADGRSLAVARRWLEELGAAEPARLLTDTNPARLLANQGPIPVDPVPEANEGMLARLRDLITGRP
jgi:protein-tyrosine phosphatase